MSMPYPANQPANVSLRPVSGIGQVARIMILVSLAVDVVVFILLVSAFNSTVDAVNNLVANEGNLNDLTTANAALEQSAFSASGEILLITFLYFAFYIATGIVFLNWAWRVRVNAEAIAGPQSQRLGRPWTIWGWVCPVVNYWFPYQIMVDIYRASRTDQSDTGQIVLWWWLTPVISGTLGFIIITASGAFTPGLVIVAIGQLVWAGFILTIMNRITEWQAPGRAIGQQRPGPGQVQWR